MTVGVKVRILPIFRTSGAAHPISLGDRQVISPPIHKAVLSEFHEDHLEIYKIKSLAQWMARFGHGLPLNSQKFG